MTVQDASFHVLIVDDEPLARRRIESLCERIAHVDRIDIAQGGQEAIELIGKRAPEIVLLDVDMPDVSGMDVAEHCRGLPREPAIIFTTAHSKYAVEAFRYDAADYLLKPVKEVQLKEAFGRVRQKQRQPPLARDEDIERTLWVQDRTGALQVRCADIEWITADRDYMRLCLADRSYLVHESMHSLSARLPEGVFLRIHRSTIVRKSFVEAVRRTGRRHFVVLKNGRDLTVGPSYLAAVNRFWSG